MSLLISGVEPRSSPVSRPIGRAPAVLLAAVSFPYSIARRNPPRWRSPRLGGPSGRPSPPAVRRLQVDPAAGAGRYLALGGALGVLLVLVAAALGLPVRLFAIRLPAGEPWVLPTVVGWLIAAGAVACWIPARRALSILPTEALRFD